MRLHPERRFYFALAEKLGMTVGELLGKISSKELTEWSAYYRIKQVESDMDAADAENRRTIRGQRG
jgi:hypothetical protein